MASESTTGGTRHSRYLVFGASSVALLMSSIDATIVATALPTMTRELATSITWSSWAVTAYLLGQTVAMPLAGKLSDSLGRRRMFLAYVATFTLASLACGLALNVYVLIVFRFIQALGGGGFMPSAMGVVSDNFGRDRDRAIGLFSSVFPLGAMLGPALGGFIVGYWSWRGIFFVNVPVGAVLLVLLAWALPRRSERPREPAVDFPGSLLLSLTLLSVMLGLNQLGERGPSSPLPWGLMALGGGAGAAFLVRQDRTPYPIIAPALLKRRAFGIVNGLNLLYGASAIGVFSLVPLYAFDAYRIGALQAGTLLTVRAFGMMAVSLVASLAIRRTGYRPPIFGGFVLIAGGLVLMAIPDRVLGPYAWLAVASLACGMGVGLAGPASNNAAIELLPDQVAAISGLRGMFRQVGGIVSISVIALLIAQQGRPVAVLREAFAGLALLVVAAIPAIIGVPERRR
ncbi:MAG TPA: MFS transporter [Candidatus Dormibacteraeota bacterium]|nr:MFS transporter [Candidatus Dormibacteraeota bacterium]